MAKSIRNMAALVAVGVLALTGCAAGASDSTEKSAASLDFWTQIYGDPAEWRETMEGLATDFEEETGTAVKVEFIDFAQSRDRWLLVSQGSDAPDVGDMYQLHTNVQLGGGKAGPMPISDYQEKHWPDLEERFTNQLLDDAQWEGEFYGIPWRADPRVMIYRTDLLEAAGLSGPPATWDEVREYSEALTDEKAQKWGFTFGSLDVVQGIIPSLWQAGGDYLSPDGKTATIDTPEMREALKWMSSLTRSGLVPPDFMDPNYDPMTDFRSGRVAMIAQANSSDIDSLARDYPELDGKWAAAPPPAGPANGASYTGSGYWGVLHGTEHPDEAVEFVEFLSRDENMQTISEASGAMSTNLNVMKSDHWTSEEYQKVIGTVLAEEAHSSQAPSPFWTIIRDEKPGGVLWDLFSAVLVSGEDIDSSVTTAQQRMQEVLDRGK